MAQFFNQKQVTFLTVDNTKKKINGQICSEKFWGFSAPYDNNKARTVGVLVPTCFLLGRSCIANASLSHVVTAPHPLPLPASSFV